VGLPVLTPTATPTVDPADFRMLQPGDDPRPPVGALDTSKSYKATIRTDKGDIVLELFDDIAPRYVENFINLSRIGYYDGVTFHRVLENFMAQGGDPTGTGSGSPGYRFNDQFHPDMHNDAGHIAMANAGLHTNGSQFFITFTDQRRLDPYDASGNLKPCQVRGVSCHAVFGKVVEGMDVLMSITLRDPQKSPGFTGDKINTIVIEEF
jgi:cyclophilin family peptidyl-prolyl cis-trans isomerase